MADKFDSELLDKAIKRKLVNLDPESYKGLTDWVNEEPKQVSLDPSFAKQMLGGGSQFIDSGREASAGAALDSMTGAPIRKAASTLTEGKGLIEALKSGAKQFGKDTKDTPEWADIAYDAGVRDPYTGAALATMAQVLEPGLPMGKAAGVAGTVAKSKLPKILEEIDTAEKAVALKGPQREKYLKALDEVFGNRAKRSRDMGFAEKDWYHGTTVPIDKVENAALGQSTGAQSARKGFFAAEDPSTASDYASLAHEKGVNLESINATLADRAKNDFIEQMQEKYGRRVLAFGANEEAPSWWTKMSDKEKATFQDLSNKEKLATKLHEDRNFKEKAHYGEYQDKRDIWNDLLTRKQQEEKRLNSLKGWQKAVDEKADWLTQSANREGVSVSEFVANKTKRLQEPIKKASKKEIEKAKQDYFNELKNFTATNSTEYANKILDHDLKVFKGEERQAILDAIKHGEDINSSSGQNVMPLRLKGTEDNIHIKDYKGESYRDSTYADEMDKAIKAGKKGVLFKNTYDYADPTNQVKQNIAAIIDPSHIRSKFAAFDPRFADSPLLMAGGIGALSPEHLEKLAIAARLEKLRASGDREQD